MVSSLGATPHFFAGHSRTASASSTSSNSHTNVTPIFTTPIRKMETDSNTYSFALQKYMLLQEQHQELCLHLDQIRPQSESTRSLHTTPSSSPTRSSSSSMSVPSSPRRHSRSSERRHRSHARCSGWNDRNNELTTIIDEETICEISAEEQRLSNVNESIKRALTELLNCSAVRSDRSLRMWVQTRLMETEKELRSGRRRRSTND